MLADLRAARSEAGPGDGGAAMLIDEKTSAAEAALAAAADVTIDAITETETACPTESFAATVSVWNAGSRPVVVESVALASPDGWQVPAPAAASGRTVAAGQARGVEALGDRARPEPGRPCRTSSRSR